MINGWTHCIDLHTRVHLPSVPMPALAEPLPNAIHVRDDARACTADPRRSCDTSVRAEPFASLLSAEPH